jgi:hypothetical protein
MNLYRISKLRAKRLQEINAELEEAQTTDPELGLVLSKIRHFQERIRDERYKDELAARRYRANPPPNQKFTPFNNNDNYQVGIYQTQMAKCICKLFFVFMRSEIRLKRIRENLLEKMQDEIYGTLLNQLYNYSRAYCAEFFVDNVVLVY